MNLRSPKTLRGKFFNIHLYLETGQSNSTVRVKHSELFRHRVQLNDISEYLDPQKIKNRQQTISKTLSANIEFLVLNFSEIIYIKKAGEQHAIELSPGKVAKCIDSIIGNSKIKKQRVDRFEYSFGYFPFINSRLTKDLTNSNLINMLIDEIGLNNDPETILILTGEMIWSRYLNSFVIINLLRKMSPMKYVYLDGNGVWDYLLRNDTIGDFANLEKKELLPQILYLEMSEGENKIIINEGSDLRNVYLINSLNIFNFIAGKYEYKGNMIPEYLIINKELRQKRDNKFTQIKDDLYGTYKQSVIVVPQMQQEEVSKEIHLLVGDNQDCTKKVGEWIDENETIGTYKSIENDFYFIPRGYNVKVFHGQLLKKGETVAEHTYKSKIIAKNAGKVDTQNIEKSIIKLQVNEEQHKLLSPFAGEVVGIGRKGEILLDKVTMSVFKVDAYIGKGIGAKLTQKVLNKHIVYCESYSDLSMLLDEYGSIKPDLELKGIIVNYLAWSEWKIINSMEHKGLNLAVISLESPNNPFSKQIISEHMNSFIYMDKEGIFFKADGQRLGYIEKSHSLNNKIVRFIDFEEHILYGKIIKSINENNQDYLIDNQDRIIECNLINFIEMANGK